MSLQSRSNSSEELTNRWEKVIEKVPSPITQRIIRVDMKFVERAVFVAWFVGVLHAKMKTKEISPLRAPVMLDRIPKQHWVLSCPVAGCKGTAGIVAGILQYLSHCIARHVYDQTRPLGRRAWEKGLDHVYLIINRVVLLSQESPAAVIEHFGESPSGSTRLTGLLRTYL